jgi:hypothetical protein
MAPRNIHKEEEIEEFASAGKTMVTCVTVMNFLPGRLADSLQGQHYTNGEAVQSFVRARKTVLESDGLQVWCCEDQ